MIAEFKKYKHYLIFLTALLLAHYVLIPLENWRKEQQLNLQLITKQYEKTQSLLNNEDLLLDQIEKTKKKLLQIKEVMYLEPNEDKFKLTAQSAIEKALTAGKCEIERIGFKGSTLVDTSIQRWLMEIRFKGDLLCLTNTTRRIETLSPYVQIVDYNYNHKRLSQDVKGNLNAQMSINVWRKVY